MSFLKCLDKMIEEKRELYQYEVFPEGFVLRFKTKDGLGWDDISLTLDEFKIETGKIPMEGI